MVVLAIVAVDCFIGGMWAATTWLPPLAEGPVGSLVYFAVCGLAGAVLAIFGPYLGDSSRTRRNEAFHRHPPSCWEWLGALALGVRYPRRVGVDRLSPSAQSGVASGG